VPLRPARARLDLIVAAACLSLLAGCSDPSALAEPTAAGAASLDASAVAAQVRPAAGTLRPTVVAFVTDYGTCDEGQAAVADMVDSWGVAAVVTGGDNSQSFRECIPYEESVEPYYGDYLAQSDPPAFFPALGNHDYTDPGAGPAAYRNAFPHLPTDADPQSRWYEQTIGAITFFVLDSEAPAEDLSAQRRWVQGALADSTATDSDTWRVVVFHRPAHTSGHHAPWTPMQEASGWDFAGWGADLVLSGHQHIFEDVVVDGLHHVTGTTGALGTVRECPTERVQGSRVCLEGAGALRLTATADTLHVQLHLAAEPATAAHRITLQR
jgi:hypothetical protein